LVPTITKSCPNSLGSTPNQDLVLSILVHSRLLIQSLHYSTNNKYKVRHGFFCYAVAKWVSVRHDDQWEVDRKIRLFTYKHRSVVRSIPTFYGQGSTWVQFLPKHATAYGSHAGEAKCRPRRRPILPFWWADPLRWLLHGPWETRDNHTIPWTVIMETREKQMWDPTHSRYMFGWWGWLNSWFAGWPSIQSTVHWRRHDGRKALGSLWKYRLIC